MVAMGNHWLLLKSMCVFVAIEVTSCYVKLLVDMVFYGFYEIQSLRLHRFIVACSVSN
jgi:hypothetical protein